MNTDTRSPIRETVRDCPSSPNCVSTNATRRSQRLSTLTYRLSEGEVLQTIRDVLQNEMRARILIVDEERLQVAAEFRSAFFRFVDDVNFVVEPEQKRLHFRSASRLGYYDFGVNRRRMKRISKALCRGGAMSIES